MTPKLSDELSAALQHQPGMPLEVEDPQTHTVYVLVTREVFRRLQRRPFDDTDLTPEEMLAVAALAIDDPEGWGAAGMEEYDQIGRPDNDTQSI